MQESHRKLLPFHKFLKRLLLSASIGLGMIVVALFIGMGGYHHFEKMSWIDSFANASMILSGMGPFGPLATKGGKIFAGLYALFSGLSFILIIGTIIAPAVQRFLHKFHLDMDEQSKK